MKNVIAILVSLGAVLLYQVAWAQATQTAQRDSLQAEVQGQIAEALYSRNHAGNHVIARSKQNPGHVYMNGKKYQKVSSEWTLYYKYDKSENKVYTGKYGKVNTFVNGKDTIQAAVFPKREEEDRFDNPQMLESAPGSKTTTYIRYGKNPEEERLIRAESSPDGKSFYVNKISTDPKTGDTYILRAKRNTTYPQSRTDIQGGTYQSVNHTDIRKTFGPSFKPGYNIYGPETSYR